MHSFSVAATALTFAMIALGSATSFARSLGEAGDLEHARANARAGGPVSERDKELLDRWGCLSGTNSKYCNKQSSQTQYRAERKRTR